jgi:UDP-glucuronate 4-epimerase
MKILVTGCAGFIGFHLAKYLLDRSNEVVGIDNINDYYDIDLKYARLGELGICKDSITYGQSTPSNKYSNFRFYKIDLSDIDKLQESFICGDFDIVCNLAAQAGVRYSLTNPQLYVDSNVKGFLNLLECCRVNKTKHFVYASSSSVYGLNEDMPFSTSQKTDRPASIYAATKKANELMAHCYSHIYGLPTTGLRFFTVYGPWGRPDMALFLFTKSIIEGKPIQIFNQGAMKRDFTYIDDIVNGIIKVIDKPFAIEPKNRKANSNCETPYKILNIGRGAPVKLIDFITEIEKNLGMVAEKEFLPMQNGDVTDTWANVDELKKEFNYQPAVNISRGVKNFVSWFKDYYAPKLVAEKV